VLTGAGAKADADAARARVAKAVFMVAVSLREYGGVLMKISWWSCVESNSRFSFNLGSE